MTPDLLTQLRDAPMCRHYGMARPCHICGRWIGMGAPFMEYSGFYAHASCLITDVPRWIEEQEAKL